MKKQLLLATSLMSFAALATVIDSPQAIGSIPVTTGAKQMIAVPFVKADGSAADVFELLATAKLAAGDKIHIWDSSNKGYRSWILANVDGALKWQAVTQVNIGVNEQTAKSVKRGDAFWLETSSTALFLMGYPAASAGAVSVTLAPGWNLVGSTALVEGKTVKNVENSAKGDIIVLSAGDKIQRGKSTWLKLLSDGTTSDMSDVVLSAGTGFWYFNSGDSSKAIKL